MKILFYVAPVIVIVAAIGVVFLPWLLRSSADVGKRKTRPKAKNGDGERDKTRVFDQREIVVERPKDEDAGFKRHSAPAHAGKPRQPSRVEGTDLQRGDVEDAARQAQRARTDAARRGREEAAERRAQETRQWAQEGAAQQRGQEDRRDASEEPPPDSAPVVLPSAPAAESPTPFPSAEHPRGWAMAAPPMDETELLAAKTAEAAKEAVAQRPGERLFFTTGYPSGMSPEQWYSLVVFMHIRERAATVREKLAKRAHEFGSEPAQASSSSSTLVSRGTRLRLQPRLPGVVCNPEYIDTSWCEDIQEVDFRLCAPAELAGKSVLGAIEVYSGPLMIGQVALSVSVRAAGSVEEAEPATASTAMFEKIFASYSHKNAEIVKACATAYKALGVHLFIDSESLHSGENWEQKLLAFIRDSDVFQLYWSEDSRASTEVEKEWRAALVLLSEKGDLFIRPLYWTPPPPAFPAPLQELRLHAAFLDVASMAVKPGSASGAVST